MVGKGAPYYGIGCGSNPASFPGCSRGLPSGASVDFQEDVVDHFSEVALGLCSTSICASLLLLATFPVFHLVFLPCMRHSEEGGGAMFPFDCSIGATGVAWKPLGCKVAGFACNEISTIEGEASSAADALPSQAVVMCQDGLGLDCEGPSAVVGPTPPQPPDWFPVKLLPTTTTATTTTTLAETARRQLPRHARVVALFKQRLGEHYHSANATLAALDADQNGTLDRNEFIDGVVQDQLLDSSRDAKFAFTRFDVDHDEQIDHLEFYGTLNNLPDWLLT